MAPSKSKKETQSITKIIDEVEKFNLSSSRSWPDLDALSTHTVLDGIEVDPSGVVINSRDFEGVANVYVTLEYGKANEKEDAFTTSEGFIGTFKGHFNEKNEAKIDTFSVNTKPFYEGAE